jgi:hypothetical protein
MRRGARAPALIFIPELNMSELDVKPLPSGPSINDSLQTSNPSWKTVLLVFGCIVAGFVLLALYFEFAK